MKLARLVKANVQGFFFGYKEGQKLYLEGYPFAQVPLEVGVRWNEELIRRGDGDLLKLKHVAFINAYRKKNPR